MDIRRLFGKSFEIICLLLALFFSTSCTNEYFDYHAKRDDYIASRSIIESSLSHWSSDTILETHPSLFSSPGTSALESLIRSIDTAHSRVYLEVYMLSEKRIIEALKSAKNRGLDVCVILEPNPFGNTSINKKTFATLQAAAIDVRWADGRKYVYTHAKFFLIDDSYIIMTANMTHSAFVANREFYLRGADTGIFATLLRIFRADLAHEDIAVTHPNLVISPLDARSKLEGLLQSAKKDIRIYAETFDDDHLESLLREKAKAGVAIRIILTSPKKITSNASFIDRMRQAGIQVSAPIKPVIHAKSLIIDDHVAYVGSINFTTNSMGRNREIGLVFTDSVAIRSLAMSF